MSVKNSDEESFSSINAEEIESPRKRLRLDNSARKSWSLMDRRTDQEMSLHAHLQRGCLVEWRRSRSDEQLGQQRRRVHAVHISDGEHSQRRQQQPWQRRHTSTNSKTTTLEGVIIWLQFSVKFKYFPIWMDCFDVLQEMGVSILEPDENETQCDISTTMGHQHKTLKRKRDIENVNPNVNSSISSPRSKCSPKSPKSKVKVCSPGPGPSKARSPMSSEKTRPLQPTDLEETFLDEYLIDEETPLAQSVAAKYCDLQLGPGFGPHSATGGKKADRFTPLGAEEEHIVSRPRTKSEPQGADSFGVLSDEMILSVFRWLPKRTLAHCMLVCKRWYQVACDESLWQRLDLGNKTLSKDALGRILARKPAVVRLANSEIGEWRPKGPPFISRLLYLDLSISTIDLDTLDCLLERCPALKKLSLENIQLRDTTCELIGRCKNLETLNLTMAQGVTAEGLTFILNGCVNLLSLNISWCNLSEAALAVLVTSLPPRLQRLNIGGARIITNDMVGSLVERCPRLLELDLSDCSQLGVDAVQKVQELTRLDHLALSRCYLLPPHALTKLSSMPSLQFLDVWGMLPSKSLSALRSALPAIQINQFMFSAIARPTVGAKRTSIWGLRTRD